MKKELFALFQAMTAAVSGNNGAATKAEIAEYLALADRYLFAEAWLDASTA